MPTQVTRSVEITIGSKTTMATNKTTGITRTDLSAVRTGLGSHIRIDLLDEFSLHLCFVSDELLQLVETPTIEPSVQSFSLMFVPAIPNTFEVFQDNSICISDNLFGDVVVNMTHKSFLSSTYLLEKAFGRLRAFALQSSPKILILHNLGLMTTEHLAIRSDSEVVYSDINTNNIIASNLVDANVFRESDVQEIPTLSVSYDVSSLVTPSEIFAVIVSDMDWNINPSVIDCEPDIIRFESECSPVISQRDRFENNLVVTGFIRFKSSCDSIYAELRFQLKSLSHIIIDKVVQVKLMLNLMLKSLVRSILTSIEKFGIQISESRIFRNLDFNGYSHTDRKEDVLFKYCAGMSSGLHTPQFIPRLKPLGILEVIL